MRRLEGKRAVITGAARGIGATFAKAYVAEGAEIVILDINLEAAQATAAEIGEGASARRLDVSDVAEIERVVAEIAAEGPIDILVNNAALFDMAPVWDVEEASYDKLFTVNVKGPLFMMKAVSKRMIEAKRGGKIINMASQAGRRGEGLVLLYCATKAAIISMTQSAGLALIPHGINVNAIAPGVVDGEHWAHVDEMFAKYENRPLGEKKKLVGDAVPFGRMGTADDLVGMAVFLASRDSDYVVSQTYNVDGGNWMS